MLVIDTYTGKVLDTQDVNNHLKRMRPYREWLRENAVRHKVALSWKNIYVSEA